MCITNWHGLDPEKEICLLKYGLLVRWDRRSKSYQCLYKVSRNKWGISNITPNQLDNILLKIGLRLRICRNQLVHLLVRGLDCHLKRSFMILLTFVDLLKCSE